MRQNKGRLLHFLDSIRLDQNAIQLQILFLKIREEVPGMLFGGHWGYPTSTGSECRRGGVWLPPPKFQR